MAGLALTGTTIQAPPAFDDFQDPAIFALDAGGFVLTARGSTYDPLTATTISTTWLQLYDDQAQLVGNAFALPGLIGPESQDPAITGLANGGYAVAYEVEASNSGANFQESALLLVGSDGVPASTPILVNTSLPGAQYVLGVHALENGRVLVEFFDVVEGTAASHKARIFNADGTAATPVFGLNVIPLSENPSGASAHVINALPGGGFSVTGIASPYSNGIAVHNYDANGIEQGAPSFTPFQGIGLPTVHKITILSDGGLLVTRPVGNSPHSFFGTRVEGHIWNADGTLRASGLVFASIDPATPRLTFVYDSYQVLALKDGGFIFAWDDEAIDPTTLSISLNAQLYTNQGTAVGSFVELPYGSNTLVELADGTVVSRAPGSSNSQTNDLLFLAADFVGETITGTGNADILPGTTGEDTLIGLAGADVMDGKNGGDSYIFNPGEFIGVDTITDTGRVSDIDQIQITTGTAITDAAFANISGIEWLRLLAPAGPLATVTLGANAQAAGITQVEARTHLDASAMSVGLSVAAFGNVRTGSGADIVTLQNAVVRTVDLGGGDDRINAYGGLFNQSSFAGGAGVDTITIGDGPALPVSRTISLTFGTNLTGFETVVLSPGLPASAVAGGPDLPAALTNYSVTITNAAIASGASLAVTASALRSGVVFALGADGEIGGEGANADVLRSERLILDASAVTGARSVTVTGGAGDDRITGSAGADVLTGGDGLDMLDGGLGVDTLLGGLGNDVFIVNSALDSVIEFDAQGIDTVRSAVSFTLPQHVEVLAYTGIGNFTGTGNALDNSITGLGGADVLSGLAGNDRLYGGDGADRLVGGDGADTLDGGSGVDRLEGGLGNDTYIVDDLLDLVAERAGEGTDAVKTGLSAYTLARNIERLDFTGSGQFTGIGNAEANIITGGADHDQLSGMAGNDKLYGHEGIDALTGGLGIDTMTGGAGFDRFLFNLITESGRSVSTADHITDFSMADGDRIELNLIDADNILNGDQAFTFIGSAAFSNVAGQVRAAFDGTYTRIELDVEGNGTIDMMIRLTGDVALTADAFLL